MVNVFETHHWATASPTQVVRPQLAPETTHTSQPMPVVLDRKYRNPID